MSLPSLLPSPLPSLLPSPLPLLLPSLLPEEPELPPSSLPIESELALAAACKAILAHGSCRKEGHSHKRPVRALMACWTPYAAGTKAWPEHHITSVGIPSALFYTGMNRSTTAPCVLLHNV